MLSQPLHHRPRSQFSHHLQLLQPEALLVWKDPASQAGRREDRAGDKHMLVQRQAAWGKVTGARQGGCKVGLGEQGPGRGARSPASPHLCGCLEDALGDVPLQVIIHLVP